MKKIKKILVYAGALLLLGIVAMCMYHQVQLHKESVMLKNKGTLVEVDHHKINVYNEGHGDDTYVFMAGSGIAAPMYEMKELYSKFSQEHKIAVIERAGYGFSDITEDNRDIDIILKQTRAALLQSGNNPPYVLVPHSISGVEAIYWAQKCPEEIKGIIALDIGLPGQYVKHKMGLIDTWMIKSINLLTKIGLHRLTPSQVYNPQVMKQSFLTEEEKAVYQALSYKQFFNNNMKNELLQVYENSLQSEKLPKPQNTPILFIDAIAEENKYTKQKRKDYRNFAEQLNLADVKEVRGTHSIYLYKPDEIYQLAMTFMEEKVDSKERSIK